MATRESRPRGKTHRARADPRAYTAAMDNRTWKQTCIAITALVTLVSVAFIVREGVSLEAVQFAALSALLGWASAEDLRSRIIPNACIISTLGVRAVTIAAQAIEGRLSSGEVVYYVASGIAVMVALTLFELAFERATGREGMGGGDVKLYAVAGFYLGIERAMGVVALSCILVLIGSALMPSERGERVDFSRAVPFGPAIAISFILSC